MDTDSKTHKSNENGVARDKIHVPSSSKLSHFFIKLLPLSQPRSTAKNPTHSAVKPPQPTGDMNGEVHEIDTAAKASSSSSSTEPQISRWVTEPVDGSTVHGVENELMVLQKMLGKRDCGGGGFKAIGIVGVRGIGKSTISQALLRNPEVKSEFLPRIWVSMSREFVEDEDPKKALVKRILNSLGVEMNDFLAGQTLGGLLYALRLQLRGKRYLIVLDDAKEIMGTEEEKDWYADLNSSEKMGEKKLRDGFPRGDGGAVIVTSRSERAATAMVGEKNLRCLVAQKDPESFWEIFRQEAKIRVDEDLIHNSSNPKELKVELLNKCGGLPLAAKMMGQIKFKEIPNQLQQQQQQ